MYSTTRVVALLGAVASFGNAVAVGTLKPGWKEYAGMGFSYSELEFRGEVPNESGTAAGCIAAAQAMPACAGVNYATWRTSKPTVCYTSRMVPGKVPGSKLVKAASMTSIVGPLPPVPRTCPKIFRSPAFVRHFNFSVVPHRCGHINMEPLLPPELSNEEVLLYTQITLDALGIEGSGLLSGGECGKVYDDHECLWQNGTIRCEVDNGPDRSAVNFTKRNNPPTVPTPWVAAGSGPFPGARLFASECLYACKCVLHNPAASSLAAHTGAPPCTDSTLTGFCKVCGQAFNDKLAGSLVQLFCDPTDPNCNH